MKTINQIARWEYGINKFKLIKRIESSKITESTAANKIDHIPVFN